MQNKAKKSPMLRGPFAKLATNDLPSAFAWIGVDDFGLTGQLLAGCLNETDFLTTGTVKVASERRQGLDNDWIGVALDGVKGFHAGKVATPLIELRYDDTKIDNVERVLQEHHFGFSNHSRSTRELEEIGLFLLRQTLLEVIASGMLEALSDRSTAEINVRLFEKFAKEAGRLLRIDVGKRGTARGHHESESQFFKRKKKGSDGQVDQSSFYEYFDAAKTLQKLLVVFYPKKSELVDQRPSRALDTGFLGVL